MFVLQGSGLIDSILELFFSPSWSWTLFSCFQDYTCSAAEPAAPDLPPPLPHVLCSRSLHPSELTADRIVGVATTSGVGPIVWLLNFCQSNHVTM